MKPKILKKKYISSSISIVISMSLVLFALGILSFLLINSNRLSNHIKENVGFSIMIKDGMKEIDILQLEKLLDAAPYSIEVERVNKDIAAKKLQEELGEDFIAFLGYNPLLESFDIKLNATYAKSDSLILIENTLMRNEMIHEVFYHKDLVKNINHNVQRISFLLACFSLLLFIISFALINNTIRLSVYSKRFLIRTMKLVGATNRFIKTPFLLESIYNGIYSALLANFMLLGVFQILQSDIPRFLPLTDFKSVSVVFGCIFVFGMLFTFVSTFFALKKYLSIKESQLYL